MISQNKIAIFWDWFVSRASEFDSWLGEDRASLLASELQARVGDLSPAIGWEVGPGSIARNYLAFTLNGDIGNLAVVREVLAFAPHVTHWEFLSGRPPRPYNPQLLFRNKKGQSIEINLDEWRYVLTSFDHGTFFDITVASDTKLRLDARAKEQVLRTAVQTLVGEHEALRLFDKLKFVDTPGSDWEHSATPFRYLADHIQTLKLE